MRNFGAWLLLSLPLMACSEPLMETEVFLVSEGYYGIINVVYGVESGEPKVFDQSGARVFVIPATGILHTQFIDGNHSAAKQPKQVFYYVDKQGQRHEKLLPAFGRVYNAPTKLGAEALDATLVHRIYGGTFVLNDETAELGCNYKYTAFYIGDLPQRFDFEHIIRLDEFYKKHGFPCGNAVYFLDKPSVEGLQK